MPPPLCQAERFRTWFAWFLSFRHHFESKPIKIEPRVACPDTSYCLYLKKKNKYTESDK